MGRMEVEENTESWPAFVNSSRKMSMKCNLRPSGILSSLKLRIVSLKSN